MNRRSQYLFALLIVLQAAHSVEEYITEIYAVLAPARFISGLVSNDHAIGFAIVNVAVVAFGIWCYFGPVRSGQPRGRAWAWPWAVVEIANGTGHIILALASRRYVPGALTAPLLLTTALWLGVALRAKNRSNSVTYNKKRQ